MWDKWNASSPHFLKCCQIIVHPSLFSFSSQISQSFSRLVMSLNITQSITHAFCHGLRICVSPCPYLQFVCGNLDTKAIVFWRGDLVMKAEPWWMGFLPLKKRFQRAPSLLPACEDTVRGQRTATQDRTLPRMWPCWHVDLGLPAWRAVRNKFLFFETYQPTRCGILLEHLNGLRHVYYLKNNNAVATTFRERL